MPNIGFPRRARARSGSATSRSFRMCTPRSTSPPDTKTRSHSSSSLRASAIDARGLAMRASTMRADVTASAPRIIEKNPRLSSVAVPTYATSGRSFPSPAIAAL